MNLESVQSIVRPKLIWLLFMHRHGDRTPLNMAPRDKYNNIEYWPEGFGNLNNAGRLRMYRMGKYIRRRYGNFITDNIREIYSRSSDVERCIESSLAVLAGLYPPKDKNRWNPDIPWTPMPVHSVPPPEDYLLNEAGRKYFHDFVKEIQLLQKTQIVKKLYEDSAEERELLERELGYDFDSFVKFKCIYSNLEIEENNGLELPSWYTPELKERLYRYSGIAFALAGGGTELLKKTRSGHLLQDMLNRMDLASVNEPNLSSRSEFSLISTETDYRKIVHYSTHDSLIAALLESLNLNRPYPIPPGFGATFFFELYVDVDELGEAIGEKHLKIYYLDNPDTEQPVEKILPDCKLDEKNRLTLDNFREYVRHLLPDPSDMS